MTTDRFYGGISDRLQNLRSMLAYIRDEHPSRDELNQWVIENTQANNADAVSHHLAFLDSIELIKLSNTRCELAEYGQQWLQDQDPGILYQALTSGVKGFDTILDALLDGPMTDEDIMDLLVREFDEAEMTKPGPAVRHREWLQVLGFVEREGGINRLTSKGRELLDTDANSEVTEYLLMRAPPEGVSVGDRLSKEEIEEAFDTGFGYRISGINPRRDEQDRRYVLVFANEDGPYSDSVTEGRFEYIGEGLNGDQTVDSPGNSVLIDACTSNIPVHFFYKGIEEDDWEYQGLIDVVDYEFREQEGREVLVFTMEHQDLADSSEKDDKLDWLGAIRLELERYQEQHDESVVTLHELYDFSEHRLSIQFPENNHMRAKIRQQLQRLRDRGEVEFLDEQGTYRINVGDEIRKERTELEQELDSEPKLTEESEQYTESRRRVRDHAFAELVKEVYNQTCAICEQYRETPAGNPEVETAHIYPKREGGRDDVRNGIALCKLHHWAFDTGWLSLSDEHEILVKDAPERNGYHEFKQLEEERIRLPDEEAEPHPIFLREHRQLHGFDNE